MSSLHVAPKWHYFAVFTALMALTALTVVIAFIDLGWINTPLAMGIAVFKALLVALIFMHLLYSGKLIALVASTALFWLAIMLVLTAADYVSRGWHPVAPW